MNIKILGFTFRLEILIAILFVYMLLSGHLICGCSKMGFREAFTVAKTLGEASINYKMGDGVKGSWDGKKQHDRNVGDTVSGGTETPLNGTLFFFKDNKGSHNNCTSNYSTSTGCVGLTSEQSTYLNTRGGNRITGEY